MDIQDYLYAIRRRLWLPIALPLVAALVTAGFIYLQPEKYEANATIVVPALSAKGYSTSAVTQYVSTFKDVLVSTQVIEPVSLQTGERRSDLVSGLSASTATASSNIITVTYTGPTKKTVQDVAWWASVYALDALLAPQQAGANDEVANANAALVQADQNLSDFTKQTGLLFPEDDYKNQSTELSQLQVLLQEAVLAGDSKRARGLQAVVNQRSADLTKLSAQVIQWQRLDEARTSAQTESDKAVIDLNAANSEVASDHAPGTVISRFAGHVSRIPEIARYAGVAAGVALLLSLGYIVFMEFLHPAVPTVAAGGFRGALGPARRRSVKVPVGATMGPGAATIDAAPEASPSQAPKSSNGEL
jgi:subunit length determinant Wzz-like protein